ncbi:ATP-binding protein [Marinobacter sp. LV10MA510-1]|uniref:ATP-binding protein n=1 Tax=Marinobacter sp. LV10MA510-1 TaxID=1415567 RepID=UPI001E5EEBE9|nr:ATP-binding protein [Marinobacter sp. LV10MA510-1]
MNEHETLKAQASALKLHGLLSHWNELTPEQTPWLAELLAWEISERKQRSLERRLSSAKLGRFKSLTEFDWQWPAKIDQQAVHRVMQLDFIQDPSNIILIGSNGVGKSTIAQNVGYPMSST